MTLYKKLIAISLLLVAAQHHVVIAVEPAQIKLPEPGAQQQSLQDPDYPRYSTDKNMYEISVVEQPAEPGIVIEPVVISDKKVGNYFNNGVTRTLITQETHDGKLITTTEKWITRNPSYLTGRNVILAVGATFITYVIISKIRADVKESVKIYNLKKELHCYFTPDDETLRFIARLTKNMSADQYDDFVRNLNQRVKTTGSWSLDRYDIAQVYVQTPGILVDDNVDLAGPLGAVERFLGLDFFRKWMNGYVVAYHEGGHLLMMAKSKKMNFDYATTIGYGHNLGYAVPSMPERSWKTFFVGEENKLENIKHEIMMDFSGPIAASMMGGGRKLTYSEFIAWAPLYGGGSFKYEESDLGLAHKSAQEYLQATGTPVSSEAINQFLEQCYHDAYDILDQHQAELAKIAGTLHNNQVITDTQAYQIVGETKQDYY